MIVELLDAKLQDVEAEALLHPVDGLACVLGGAATQAIRAALPPDERMDELEDLEVRMKELKPLSDGDARVIEGVARWNWIVVSAAYPHNAGDRIFTPEDCAARVRTALANAFQMAGDHQIKSIAVPLIGTQYRMPVATAVNAFADGLASARDCGIRVLWCAPDVEALALATAACARLGLTAAARQVT
jgi:O-acetyl-ADP-ribose deacetylase (regulator of RNase III)